MTIDEQCGVPVALVNRSFADRFWPGEQPLGKRLRAIDRNNRPEVWRRVVGVDLNIMQGDPTRQHFKPEIYVPLEQQPTAAGADIRRMVLRDGMLPVTVGMILGLAASLAVNRILQSQLVGVSPYDPMAMAAAPVVWIVVALVTCHIPAGHESRPGGRPAHD